MTSVCFSGLFEILFSNEEMFEAEQSEEEPGTENNGEQPGERFHCGICSEADVYGTAGCAGQVGYHC